MAFGSGVIDRLPSRYPMTVVQRCLSAPAGSFTTVDPLSNIIVDLATPYAGQRLRGRVASGRFRRLRRVVEDERQLEAMVRHLPGALAGGCHPN